jgi:pimeloyl-ACP methyl ester carboxylesterase
MRDRGARQAKIGGGMTRGSDFCTVRLPDGRQLAYGSWGDPGGSPVILMHGWPGSRLCGRLVASAAVAETVRLIVPDRPGMGRSDPRPGRSLLDWADDIAALADALGLGRFSLVGYSGGVPYALACAFRLPDRLTHVALVSGLGPLHTRQGLSALPLHLKTVFSLSRHLPGFALLPAGLISLGIRRVPEAVALQARWTAGGEDRRVLARKAVFESLREEYLEAFRQGVFPVADEVRITSRPWGFPLAGLPAGIHLYHGDADRFVPVAQTRALARALPSCRCRIVPGAGHFWLVDHFAQVLMDRQREGGPGPVRLRFRTGSASSSSCIPSG